MPDRLALLREMSNNVVATAANRVAVLRQLGAAVDAIFLSATPNTGAEAPESWGDPMSVTELETLLPMVAQVFYGDLPFHVNVTAGTLDSRPLTNLECDGVAHILAEALGVEADEQGDFFAGDADPNIWLSLTAEQATNLLFAQVDR